eukprot:1737371-Pyramimonas_sp.AAC.1
MQGYPWEGCPSLLCGLTASQIGQARTIVQKDGAHGSLRSDVAKVAASQNHDRSPGPHLSASSLEPDRSVRAPGPEECLARKN